MACLDVEGEILQLFQLSVIGQDWSHVKEEFLPFPTQSTSCIMVTLTQFYVTLYTDILMIYFTIYT